MSLSADPPPPAEELPSPVVNLRLKAALLLLLMVLLVGGSVLYVMYARGVFERTQRLVLMADDSDGVLVGMDLTFAGFPIGRVRRTELAEDGRVRILIDVSREDARWLRRSSVFTLERGLVGGARLRAFTGMLNDEPIGEDAVRTVLRGDTTEELPRLIASARELAQNLQMLTSEGSALQSSLTELRGFTEKLNGPGGALQVLTGNEADARRVMQLIERANSLVARVDALAAKADTQVFGPTGLMPDAQATVRQLNTLLGEARASLKRVDAVLVEAQGVAANTREATVDLGALRGDVESSLRKIDALVNDINRRWPFARDPELKLP